MLNFHWEYQNHNCQKIKYDYNIYNLISIKYEKRNHNTNQTFLLCQDELPDYVKQRRAP